MNPFLDALGRSGPLGSLLSGAMGSQPGPQVLPQQAPQPQMLPQTLGEAIGGLFPEMAGAAGGGQQPQTLGDAVSSIFPEQGKQPTSPGQGTRPRGMEALAPNGLRPLAPAQPAGPDPEILAARKAVKSIESAGSGDYKALGPLTADGDRAYGAYQVMGANIGPWTKEVLGVRMSPREFLADDAAQDAVFDAKFGANMREHGADNAASIWFTGQPISAQSSGAADVLGTTGSGYVGRFRDEFSKASGQVQQQAQQAAFDAPPRVQPLQGLRWDGRRMEAPQALVIHHTGGRGSPQGVIDVLNKRGFGAHFVMDRDGSIYQIAPDGARVSHMRDGQGPGKGFGNSNTLGIEIIAKDDSDLTPQQVGSAVRWIAEMEKTNPGIGERVFGHGEVNSHKQSTEGHTVISAWREFKRTGKMPAGVPAGPAANSPAGGAAAARGGPQSAPAGAPAGDGDLIASIRQRAEESRQRGQQSEQTRKRGGRGVPEAAPEQAQPEAPRDYGAELLAAYAPATRASAPSRTREDFRKMSAGAKIQVLQSLGRKVRGA